MATSIILLAILVKLYVVWGKIRLYLFKLSVGMLFLQTFVTKYNHMVIAVLDF